MSAPLPQDTPVALARARVRAKEAAITSGWQQRRAAELVASPRSISPAMLAERLDRIESLLAERQSAPVAPSEILTVTETAKLLDIDPDTARRWAQLGQIPSHSPGGLKGKLFFLRSEIIEHLRSLPRPSVRAKKLSRIQRLAVRYGCEV